MRVPFLARCAVVLTVAVAAAFAGAMPAQAQPNNSATLARAGYTDSLAPHRAFDWNAAPVPVGAWRDAIGRKHMSRVYLTYDLRGYANSVVTIAVLKVKEMSGDCTRRAVELWRTASTLAKPTWNRAPDEMEKIADLPQADYACPSTLGTDIAAAFDGAVRAGRAFITLEIRVAARFENNVAYGRTFDPAFGAPVSVFSNAKPSIDTTTLYANFTPCATSGPLPSVAASSLRLRARGVDADDTWALLRYEYELWPAAEPSQVITLSDGILNSGLPHDGATYSWRVRASDATSTSAWSPTCSFVVDLTPPSAPTATSPTYDPISGAWIGSTATFTFSPNGVADVAGYQYGWGELPAGGCDVDEAGHYSCPPPQTYVAANGIGGPATAQITVPGAGSWTLRVRSLDRAGIPSDAISLEVFVVLSGPPLVSSDVYVEGGEPSGGVGVTGTFTFTAPSGAPPVVTYYYSIGATSGALNPGPDGSATVSYTPTSSGLTMLNVMGYFGDDPSGEPQYSVPRDYVFTVAD